MSMIASGSNAIADQALRNAREEENSGLALGYLLMAFSAQPSLKLVDSLRRDFVEKFKSSCELLLHSERYTELFHCFEQAHNVFPDCDEICSHMGSLCYRLRDMENAVDYYRKAITINPGDAVSQENLDNILCHLVDRWHFLMLNDESRNSAFKHAIHKAVASGCRRVLDIGSGTGILSMMAAKCGAREVYACDESETMDRLAHEILQANKLSDRVNITAKHSSALSVCDNGDSETADLKSKVDLIITETIDCGLLGERILSTLSHAWRSLLNTESTISRVIPARAELYCCIIESEEIRKHHRCIYSALRQIDLTDLLFIDMTSQSCDLLPDSTKPEDEFDPYTTYNLNNIRGGYKQLTNTRKCLDVDFNSIQNIEHLLAGHMEITNLTMQRSGHCDAVALWFDLYLDETSKLSSNPSGPVSCWYPAIFPLSRLPRSYLTKDQTVSLELLSHDDCIEIKWVSCEDITTQPDTMTLRSLSLLGSDDNQNSTDKLNGCDIPITVITQSEDDSTVTDCDVSTVTDCDMLYTGDMNSGKVLTQMSDTDLPLDTNEGNIPSDSTSGGSTNTPSTESNMDSNSTGRAEQSEPMCCKCSYNQRSTADHHTGKNKQVLLLSSQEIYRMNDIYYSTAVCIAVNSLISSQRENSDGSKHFTLLDMSPLFTTLPIQCSRLDASDCFWLGSSDYHKTIYKQICDKNDVTSVSHLQDVESCAGMSLDCVLADLVEPNGTLRQHVLNDLAYIKLSALTADSGVIIPGKLHLFGICINSVQLMETSCVISNRRTCGFKIAPYINDYQALHQRDIDLSTLDYTRITDPSKLISIDLNATDIDSKGLPTFLNQLNTVQVESMLGTTCVVNAVVYWFELELSDTVKISTLDAGRHWKQAAALAPIELMCKKNQKLSITTRITNGCLGISVS